MSIFAEYKHGGMDYDELRQAFNFLERDDDHVQLSEEEICWQEGTGEGNCELCDWRFECSGSPYSEEDDE